MAFFLKLELKYLSKMHGYPQFSFWIPRVLTKIYFLRIVLNRAKISLYLYASAIGNPSIWRCAERMRNNNSWHRPYKQYCDQNDSLKNLALDGI